MTLQRIGRLPSTVSSPGVPLPRQCPARGTRGIWRVRSAGWSLRSVCALTRSMSPIGTPGRELGSGILARVGAGGSLPKAPAPGCGSTWCGVGELPLEAPGDLGLSEPSAALWPRVVELLPAACRSGRTRSRSHSSSSSGRRADRRARAARRRGSRCCSGSRRSGPDSWRAGYGSRVGHERGLPGSPSSGRPGPGGGWLVHPSARCCICCPM